MWESLKAYITDLGKWGWLVMVANIFTAINVYSTITGHPFIDIPVWVWVSLLIPGLLFVPFFAYHRIRTKLNGILLAVPNIELYGSPYVDTRSIYSVTKVKGQFPLFGTPFFAHIIFCNNPQVRSIATTAESIDAEITFFDDEEKPVLGPIFGRWEGTPQPATLSPFASIRELLKIGLEPTGLPRELDIALKYPEDEFCYAFNNVSCRHSNDWRMPKFLLKGYSFYLKVRLVGVPMLDKTWWFKLYNSGAGKGLRIETTNPLIHVVKG